MHRLPFPVWLPLSIPVLPGCPCNPLFLIEAPEWLLSYQMKLWEVAPVLPDEVEMESNALTVRGKIDGKVDGKRLLCWMVHHLAAP